MILDEAGPLALGSRLRRLSERLTEDAASIYKAYQTELKPKWFPVFYVLSGHGTMPVTTLAAEIGHSHPSVSKIVREMLVADLVKQHSDPHDGRRNLVGLSAKGIDLSLKISDQYTDVQEALLSLFDQTRHNVWKALIEFEYMLEQQSLPERVLACRKRRESPQVRVIPYIPEYRSDFKRLNSQWISTYFIMEALDHQVLDHPESYIIDRGGHILVALYKEQAVGVCALIPLESSEYDFELAKMGVAPEVRGLGIGWKLGRAIIEKAKALGARSLYLESNTVLEPAIALYRKLGFKKINGGPSPYKRSNIQMALTLVSSDAPPE